MNPKSVIELAITVFGIPAFIYSYFDDIQVWASSFDVWKTVILSIIGGGTMFILFCRQIIKMLKEWDDYINRPRPKEKINSRTKR